jgi:hypothetical protein
VGVVVVVVVVVVVGVVVVVVVVVGVAGVIMTNGVQLANIIHIAIEAPSYDTIGDAAVLLADETGDRSALDAIDNANDLDAALGSLAAAAIKLGLNW